MCQVTRAGGDCPLQPSISYFIQPITINGQKGDSCKASTGLSTNAKDGHTLYNLTVQSPLDLSPVYTSEILGDLGR